MRTARALSLLMFTILVAAPGITSALGDKDAVLMRLKLAKGMSFSYEFTNASTQFMSVATAEIGNDVSSSTHVTLLVTDATLDRSTLSATLSKATTRVSTRGLETMGVSKDTTLDLSRLDGTTSTVTLDKTGRVANVSTGADEAAGSFLSSMKIHELLVAPFPAKSVSVGDSWTTSRSDTLPTPTGAGSVITNMTLKHSYRGRRDTLGVACWLIETVSTSFEQSGALQTAAGDMTLEGTGQFIRRAWIEIATGLAVVVAGEINSQMQMAVTGQQAMVIPVDTQMRVTAIRKGPAR